MAGTSRVRRMRPLRTVRTAEGVVAMCLIVASSSAYAQNAAQFNNRGVDAMLRGDLADALRNFQEGLLLEPSSTRLNNNMLELKQRVGVGEAREEAREREEERDWFDDVTVERPAKFGSRRSKLPERLSKAAQSLTSTAIALSDRLTGVEDEKHVLEYVLALPAFLPAC